MFYSNSIFRLRVDGNGDRRGGVDVLVVVASWVLVADGVSIM